MKLIFDSKAPAVILLKVKKQIDFPNKRYVNHATTPKKQLKYTILHTTKEFKKQ